MNKENKHNGKQKNQAGFSLTELLVALIIVGLLVVMAMPKFTSVITKTKTTEAKLMLNQIYMLEEAYWDEHDKYTVNLDDIGYKPDKLATNGGSARYDIKITSATDTSFLAVATAVVDIYKNGIMDTWAINQRKELMQE